MDILPFQPEYVPRAAEILAKQFSGHNKKFLLLLQRTTDVEAAQLFLTAILNKPSTHGVVAMDGNHVMATYRDAMCGLRWEVVP